jgi:peptidoglycan biosynthesis protein MviN/MurJ (putative lipid II flippase)
LIRGLRSRLRAVHDNHRRIAAGAVLIGVLTIIAKLFAAVREMAIAWRFGIGETVDAYQLALTITSWAPMLFSGVITVVLVPRLASLRGESVECREFIAELNGTILLVGAGLTALTYAASPLASALLASGASPSALRLTTTMAKQLAGTAFFTIAIGYLSARLQARESYSYSVTEAVPAVTIALSTVVPLAALGATVLVAGTLIGYFLQALLVATLVVRNDAPLGAVRFRHRSAQWTTIYGAFALMCLGQSLIMASLPIDQAFAARLGEGSVATLGYASRITTLLSGLGTVVVGRALLPVLAKSIAAGEDQLASRQARQWSILLFAAGGAAAGGLWLIAPDVVRLLFERGAFTAAASDQVAHALRFGLLQIPAYFAGIALVQWYAATGRFRAMVGITASALALKVFLNIFLAPRLGVAGIMAATAAMYVWTAILLVVGIHLSYRRDR